MSNERVTITVNGQEFDFDFDTAFQLSLALAQFFNEENPDSDVKIEAEDVFGMIQETLLH